MKDKILLLCKRLNKFTLDEISTISELEPNKLFLIINELISENKLLQENGIYFYSKKQSISAKYSIFKYYPKVTIDLVLRCFCESISTTKTSHIISMGEDQVQNFTQFLECLFMNDKKNCLEIFMPESLKMQDTESFLTKKFIYIFITSKFSCRKFYCKVLMINL